MTKQKRWAYEVAQLSIILFTKSSEREKILFQCSVGHYSFCSSFKLEIKTTMKKIGRSRI